MVRRLLVAGSLAIVSAASWAGALEGRYLVASPPQPFDAFYDPDAKLTWLADANYVKSHCAAGPTTINRAWFEKIAAAAKPEWLKPLGRPLDTMDMECGSGSVAWPFAMALVSTLNIGGVTGWTLPPLRPSSGDTFDKSQLVAKVPAAPDAATSPLPYMMQTRLKLKPETAMPHPTGATNVTVMPKTAVPGVPGGFVTELTDGPYWLDGRGKVPWMPPQQMAISGFCYELAFAGKTTLCATSSGYRAFVWPVHEGDVGRKK